MRSKKDIMLSGLRGSHAGRGRLADAWRFVLKFEHVDGPAAAQGREGTVLLEPAELADALGAIPALVLDEQTLPALVKVQAVLQGMNKQT